MPDLLLELEVRTGKDLFDYQRSFLEDVVLLPEPLRACLYYRTGAGKSLTGLGGLFVLGHTQCLVIAPPATHHQWEDLGRAMGIQVTTMSHAKFRRKDTQLSRHMPVIADEFHLFGGQQGQGWKKLATLAKHLQAPMVLMSATPNYNDAERVYCVQHILSPHVTKGGYLQFLYRNCITQQNRFSMMPDVTGFKDYPDAASFLADLPRVYYLPDGWVMDIEEIGYDEQIPAEMEELGYNRRDHRMIASDMEYRHTTRYQGLVNDNGHARPEVMDIVMQKIDDHGTLLVYANHATVAHALSLTLRKYGVEHVLVTGSTPKKQKLRLIDMFRKGHVPVMVGTASLATGTDGLDKVCDALLIVDDTEDDALRRQLIGRILPRGDDEGRDKKIFRLEPM